MPGSVICKLGDFRSVRVLAVLVVASLAKRNRQIGASPLTRHDSS
jgi:hypothetical protein